MGGNNEGPQPIEMFIASLCGCELATAQFVARNLDPVVKIEKIDFDVQAVRDQLGAQFLPLQASFSKDQIGSPPAARLQRIEGQALVHTNSSQEQIDRLAADVKLRCPVANMVVLSGCDLDIKWTKAPSCPGGV
jgi:uncharacterized OsmC-like protein